MRLNEREKADAMKRKVTLSTTQIIMLSFLAVILIGSLLLWMPVSSANGKGISYSDALFTATTATCVTGLVTVPTATSWSVFGQVVILLLIQIGGLGTITVMSAFLIVLHRKMGIENRLLIQDAFNLNTLSGLIRFVKKVLLGTLIIEGAGALCYMTVFVRQFGARGIWISVFNSVSAFCNAGMDIIGEKSLMDYATDPTVNAVTCLLIILGGLGYIVWWDIICVMRSAKNMGLKCLHKLTLHSKIVLSSTVIFIVVGAVAFMAFEYNNPATMGHMTFLQKIQASFFQSVTTRTAGFATVSQSGLSDASAIVSLLLMFIGGSPVGTAGGVKTVTIAVIAASAYSTVVGKNEVTLFNRSVSKESVNKATAVVFMAFVIAFTSTVMLCVSSHANVTDILFETVSATATVGLSRDLTSTLNLFGKMVIIATMYLGRVGPISLALAFNVKKKKSTNIIKNPTEDISVG